MSEEPKGWAATLSKLGIFFVFVHFMALFTILMWRVLTLEDAMFVQSLSAVGGFFRDSSFAAFLVTLLRHNVPKEALKTFQAWGSRNQVNPYGSPYAGGQQGEMYDSEDELFSGGITPGP